MTVVIKSEKKAQEEAARNHKVALLVKLERKNAFRWNGKLIDFLHRIFLREKNATKVKF